MDSSAQASDPVLGDVRSVDPEILRARLPGPVRAAQLRDAAQQAWAQALERLATDRIEPFPAEHPVHGNMAAVVGKRVLLGPLGSSDWANQVVMQVLAAGSPEQGYYFVKDKTPAGARMVAALARFREHVSSEHPEVYQILGRITDQPELRVVNGRAQWGLDVEPLCALIGDCLFVDLTVDAQGRSPFLGEESLPPPPSFAVHADDSPQTLTLTLVRMVRYGAKKDFEDGLAKEKLQRMFDNGYPDYRAYYRPDVDADWNRLRALLAGEVVDIRPLEVGPIRRRMQRTELIPGLVYPALDQVDVAVEYVGEFDGAFRAFSRSDLPTRWVFQRTDEGPWRLFLPHPT